MEPNQPTDTTISNIDFSIPRRQSYVAIIMILYKVYKRFIKAFWPIIIAFVLRKNLDMNLVYMIIVAIIVILGIYALVDFLRYRFYIQNNEFVVERGVFSRKKIVIPFERIQSINFKQNIVHQLFDVVGLEIDTAGTAKKEFDFEALDLPTSNGLRNYIFAHKTVNKTDEGILNVEGEEMPTIKAESILLLSVQDLLKIGLTQNHFRSLGIVILFLFWIIEQVRQIGIDTEDYVDLSEENLLSLGLYMAIGILVFAFFVIIIISIIRTLLKYFNFEMKRVHNGFKLEYGLFNRNQLSIMDNKVQVITWNDNLLRKIFGLFTLRLKLASSTDVKAKKSNIIPGVTNHDIESIKRFYFNEKDRMISFKEQPDIYYLYRRIVIVLVFGIVLNAVLIYFGDLKSILIGLSVLAYFLVTSFKKYAKMYFGFNNEVIEIHNGIFGDKHALFSIYKLQGVEVTQSPVQRRKALANLVMFTASGKQSIRYIKMEKAQKIRDYILFKTESDPREWM